MAAPDCEPPPEPHLEGGHAIERMAEVDVPALAAIERASTQASGWDEEQLRGEMGRSWAHVWVRRPVSTSASDTSGANGASNGMARPVAFLATWLVQDELHVLNVATDPAHRRHGHARALLDHALRFAASRGVRLLLLEVRRSNAAAIGLYRRFGFTAIGVRARYYPDDEDAVEMVLRIDPSTGEVLEGRDEVRV